MENPPPSSGVDRKKVEALIRKRSKGKSGRAAFNYWLWIGGVIGVIIAGIVVVLFNPTKKAHQIPVNDEGLISQANYARGGWKAAPSQFFEGWKLSDVLRFGAIPPNSNLYRAPPCSDTVRSISPSFDSRKQWPECFGEDYSVYESGNCTSAWAIAGASTLSNRYCISDSEKYQKLRLSPQSLLSCDRTNSGCKGGALDTMFSFMRYQGINSEKCFPFEYDNEGVLCEKKCKDEEPYKIASYCVTPSVANIQREIEANGPAMAHLVLYDDLLVYHGGIYTPLPTAKKLLDSARNYVLHPVKVLGWGKEGNKKYWIIENSWGSDWGIDGFAHIDMGTSATPSILFNNLVLAPMLPKPESTEAAKQDEAFEAEDAPQQAEEIDADDEREQDKNGDVEPEVNDDVGEAPVEDES